MQIKRAGLTGSFAHYLENLAARGFLSLALLLPYTMRVEFMGWIFARLISPLAGYGKRVRKNLNHVCPNLPKTEVNRLAVDVPRNVGRTLIEIYSGQDFIARMKDISFTGDGVDALKSARDGRKPVILVTGHFGNYDVPRAALIAHGYDLGSLYNPMKNPFFNAHYVKAIGTIGQPLFPRGRRGFGMMLKHLSHGGMVGWLADVAMHDAPELRFFDKPARTALSAAELALKYDAALVPIYGIRKDGGFDIQVEAPIPHSDPKTMTQALNDSLETLTRSHMDQWFWIHRRWKPYLQ